MSYERVAILTALAGGPIDKKDIADTVRADTMAQVVLKTSSMYRLVSELANRGYIKEQGPFHLTDKGRHMLLIELSRIEQQRLLLKVRLYQ